MYNFYCYYNCNNNFYNKSGFILDLQRVLHTNPSEPDKENCTETHYKETNLKEVYINTLI